MGAIIVALRAFITFRL